MWFDTDETYGRISVVIHWITALVIPGLFVLGLWMVDLSYYDPWYNRAPEIHKGVGILLFVVLLLRILWRAMHPKPRPEPHVSALERSASRFVHWALYLLMTAVMVSGYLVSTADGRGIDVFGMFEVPATLAGLPNQADFAGQAHLILAVSLISVATLHALAGFKHHFIDRDRTLARMLGRRAN